MNACARKSETWWLLLQVICRITVISFDHVHKEECIEYKMWSVERKDTRNKPQKSSCLQTVLSEYLGTQWKGMNNVAVSIVMLYCNFTKLCHPSVLNWKIWLFWLIRREGSSLRHLLNICTYQCLTGNGYKIHMYKDSYSFTAVKLESQPTTTGSVLHSSVQTSLANSTQPQPSRHLTQLSTPRVKGSVQEFLNSYGVKIKLCWFQYLMIF